MPLLFLAYNGGDLVGRMAAGCGRWATTPPRVGVLGAYSAARVAVAFAMLCCYVVTPGPWRLPVLFRCTTPGLSSSSRHCMLAGVALFRVMAKSVLICCA